MDLVLLGILAWTLAEYAVHRFVLHRWLTASHMLGHHLYPRDYGLGPSWSITGLWIIVALVVGWLTGLLLFVAGAVSAYAFYTGVHYVCHHGGPQWRWLRYLVRLHAVHHRNGRANFGVSSPTWDMAFGTYQRPM